MTGVDRIADIDFRLATGQLYALSTSRLYTIDLGTGVATLVAPLSVRLQSSGASIDFNPTVDRLRIVSSGGQNLRVNPVDGVVIEDGRINPDTQEVSGVAYTNSTAEATTTDLYAIGIDRNTSVNRLNWLIPPNAGTLLPLGTLGVILRNPNVGGTTDFDIGGTTNIGYATGNSDGILYTINLASGRATGSNIPIERTNQSAIVGLAIGLVLSGTWLIA